MNSQLVKKYSAPTKFDAAPCGTIWFHEDDSTKLHLFVQTSLDPQVNTWESLGDIIEKQIIASIQ